MSAKKLSTDVFSEKIVTMFKNSLLFSSLEGEEFNSIIKSFELVDFKKGDPVFIENESSEHVYFIVSGSVEIVQYKHNLKQSSRIKTLQEGNHFSEFSILTDSNHSTSCFAIEDTSLLTLSRDSFYHLLQENPKIPAQLLIVLAKLNQQVANSNNYIEYFREDLFDFTPNVAKLIPHSLVYKLGVMPVKFEDNILTIALVNPHNKEFLNYFNEQNPGVQLKVYIISQNDLNSYKKKIAGLYAGHYTRIKPDLKPDLTSNPSPLHSEINALNIRDFLKCTTLFSELNDGLIEKIIPSFKLLKLKKGDTLFSPNTESKHLFIIANGEVELLKEMSSGGLTKIATLKKNDSLSEISLIVDATHSLHAKTTVDSSFLVLNKDTFKELTTKASFSISFCKILAKRLQTINRQTHINFLPENTTVNKTLCLDLMPLKAIQTKKVIPINLENKVLTLAIVNTKDEELYEIINQYFSEYRINLAQIHPGTFETILDQLKNDTAIIEDLNASINSLRINLKEHSDTIKYTEELMDFGFSNRVSDIHIEPNEKNTIIRFRIDGELIQMENTISSSFGHEIVNRIKILSKMDISEQRYPQDGQLIIKKEQAKLQARASTVPTKFGEKCVLRLIRDQLALISMNMLVPDKQVIKFLKDITRTKQGLFIISGPTGSGKTTTLYSVLNEMIDTKKNIMTVEDPVEVIMPGLTQIEIKEEIGLNYSKVLRHILRQDPDSIMVGEIRDEESAKIVFDAALTGHLVLTTLHTNNSLDILPRLKDLGLSDSTIASGLVGSLTQRLLPAICNNCRDKRDITQKEIDVLKKGLGSVDIPKKLYYGKGCEDCSNTGYSDRFPIFEYWSKSQEVKDVILNQGGHGDFLKALEKQDFRTLNEFALHMVLNGLTTVEKVEDYLFGIV